MLILTNNMILLGGLNFMLFYVMLFLWYVMLIKLVDTMVDPICFAVCQMKVTNSPCTWILDFGNTITEAK